MARDRLIFVIICSVAIVLAVVTVAFTLFSGKPGGRIGPSQWQCLNPDCGYEFSKDTREYSPIECEKCGGQAAKVNRRKYQKCGEDVVISRMRLTEQSQAQYQNMKESSGEMRVMARRLVVDLPSEIQVWVPQADGSYAWTDWVFVGGPQIGQVFKCPECDAPLYRRTRR